MKQIILLIYFIIFPVLLWSTPAVPYSGKIDINGVNYFGDANFTFSIYDNGGITHWRNGTSEKDSIKVTIFNGRYTVILGGQGMNPLPIEVFLRHEKLYIKVHFDNGDGNGMRHLSPDQQITATPLALAAEYARIAESVAPGSITKDMLSADVLADLNRTQYVPPSQPSASSFEVTSGSITHELLSPAVLADLNSSISQITRDMLPPSVLADLNKSIFRSDLPPSVLADLNRSITRDMLPLSVLADLNKSITRSDLPSSVLADLNRTITKNNLGSDVLSDLNSSISLNRLSPEVLAALQVIPSISTQPFARYDWRTNSATIEACGRGYNLSYQWLKNGQVIAGANTPVLELSNPVLDDNATYSVQLTNSVGQTTSQTIILQQAIGAPGLPLEEANATQVPRNGLVLWLDANDIDADGNEDSLVVGDRVASWTDKISKNKAEQDDLNKEPIREISGIVFSLNHSLVIGDLNTSAKHIFIVGKRKYRQGWSFLIKGKDINQVRWYHTGSDITSGGTTDFTDGTGGSRRYSGGFTSLPIDQTFIVTLTKGNHSLDGGLFADLTIGSALDGEISEILFYDRFLQNNERDAVERYLADKWGIQLHAGKLAAEQAAYDAAKPPAEPESGLQAYYKFEPISVEPNKVWDYSGNEKHLTMSSFDGNPWVDGVNGRALNFNGTSGADRSDSTVEASTIAMWLNPDLPITGNNEPNRVFKGSYGSHHRYFTLNSPLVDTSGHFNYSYGTTRWTGSEEGFNSLLKGWIHLCLSHDVNQNEYNIFLNSQKIVTYSTNSKPGRFTFSNKFSIGDSNFRGQIDEFRMYSTSLTPAEVEGLYLQVQNPILRMAPEHNATVGTNFSLSLVADNGPTTYLAEGLPAGLSLNTTTGQITGYLSQPGYHRVFVKAMNEHGTGSDTIAIIARPQTDQYGWPVDVPDGSDIPQNGLVLWLDANDVDADGEFDTSTDHLKLSNWADKAGMDHNATQANAAKQPEIRSGQLADNPNQLLSVFEGNQTLDFPEITQVRTYFCVAEYSSSGNGEWTGILGGATNWYGGATFWSSRSSSILKNGDRRVNGISYTSGSQPTGLKVFSGVSTEFASAERIGKAQLHVSDFFNGMIGEVLFYDRVLSTTEIETVEKYLGQKWGISISHDTTPSPTGNPSTFTVTPANDSVTTAHLSEQILKYLKPEITSQPQAHSIFADTNASFSVTAEGKYLTYQWKKGGTNLTGETNATLNITDANATLHDGNYSVVVSNDFGSVESNLVEVKVNTWKPTDLNNLYIWYDASTSNNVTVVNDYVTSWHDLSGNDRNATRFDQGGPEISPDWNSTTLNNLGGLTFSNPVRQRINFVETSFHQKSISLVLNTSSQSGGAIISHKNSNRGIGFSSENKISFFGDPAPYGGISFPQVINSEFNILTINFENNVSCWLNNHPNGIHIGTADVTDKKFNQIGALYGGSNSLSGSISEVIITNSVLDSQERSLLVRYLANKWGLIHKL